jgi:hypothetical protein
MTIFGVGASKCPSTPFNCGSLDPNAMKDNDNLQRDRDFSDHWRCKGDAKLS